VLTTKAAEKGTSGCESAEGRPKQRRRKRQRRQQQGQGLKERQEHSNPPEAAPLPAAAALSAQPKAAGRGGCNPELQPVASVEGAALASSQPTLKQPTSRRRLPLIGGPGVDLPMPRAAGQQQQQQQLVQGPTERQADALLWQSDSFVSSGRTQALILVPLASVAALGALPSTCTAEPDVPVLWAQQGSAVTQQLYLQQPLLRADALMLPGLSGASQQLLRAGSAPAPPPAEAAMQPARFNSAPADAADRLSSLQWPQPGLPEASSCFGASIAPFLGLLPAGASSPLGLPSAGLAPPPQIPSLPQIPESAMAAASRAALQSAQLSVRQQQQGWTMPPPPAGGSLPSSGLQVLTPFALPEDVIASLATPPFANALVGRCHLKCW
jgi:hypothetical protein